MTPDRRTQPPKNTNPEYDQASSPVVNRVFPVSGQIGNILGFEGHAMSLQLLNVTTTAGKGHRPHAAECGCVPGEHRLPEQAWAGDSPQAGVCQPLVYLA